MQRTILGRTGLAVSRTSFGALPIQRIQFDVAGTILRKAYDNGITFFDTARAYTDSEKKIGYALSDVRKDIILATKTTAKDKKTLLDQLETSLRNLNTDMVDILQLHNPEILPDPNDPQSTYSGLLEAQKTGMIRFIGITTHRLDNAIKAVESGLYDTLQYPLSHISSQDDLKIIDLCKKHDVGLIAMKALCGGLLVNIPAAFSFLRQYENVVPIWGIQRESELDEFIALEKNPPLLNNTMWETIEKDRIDLAGNFCRGCGYCLPCPADIPIPMAARMSLLLRRAPFKQYMEDEWKENMNRITKCINCGKCIKRCPYHLNTPDLLKKMLIDYQTFYTEHM